MPALFEAVSNPEKKPVIVREAAQVLDEEVASKSGLGGLAVKGAFAMVKALKPGIITEVIEGLMPDFAKALDPILAERGTRTVAEIFVARENDVVQALLGVTDQRAKKTTHLSLLKAYQKLRPSAEKQVAAGLPRLARLVAKHTA